MLFYFSSIIRPLRGTFQLLHPWTALMSCFSSSHRFCRPAPRRWEAEPSVTVPSAAWWRAASFSSATSSLTTWPPTQPRPQGEVGHFLLLNDFEDTRRTFLTQTFWSSVTLDVFRCWVSASMYLLFGQLEGIFWGEVLWVTHSSWRSLYRKGHVDQHRR